MKRTRFLSVGATLLAVGAFALASMQLSSPRSIAAEEVHEDGRIVEISPDAGGVHEQDAAVDEQPAAPQYWIGIQGQPLDSPILRTHLQLADDVGVVVGSVATGSPAEKAGLRKHDILLAVNGEQISDMAVLQQAVVESEGKPVELKIIRLAKEMTVAVTPENAPADFASRIPGQGAGNGLNFEFGGDGLGQLNDMLRQLEQGGGMRVLGPGMLFNGQALNMNQLPGGVSVSVAREGDGPAKITVRKGDRTWNIEGDDKEALSKLPDDVRPFVEQMLRGPQDGQALLRQFGLGNLDREIESALPNRLGRFDLRVNPERAAALNRRASEATERLMQRVEELEQQVQKLHEQMQEDISGHGTN